MFAVERWWSLPLKTGESVVATQTVLCAYFMNCDTAPGKNVFYYGWKFYAELPHFRCYITWVWNMLCRGFS